ncbi:MAG TPA: tannase/feruloyl esterase family alpha/beta hydrolase [Pseudomonadaceae bacterium]|nr:tannase/feruloyl esterase family alpha/beta hydrolase [Pseudomonadaceae bacterium]
MPVILGCSLTLLGACSDPGTVDGQASGAAMQPDPQAMSVVSCSELAGLRIAASDIGLPTTGATINSAELIAGTAEASGNGDYCKVLGAIHPLDYTAPDINFQVNLPANWNGKSVQFGGGGLNGTLVTGLGPYVKQPAGEATPLARGYLTLGSDSGHRSAGGFDGTFFLNEEALMNFGHMQIKKTHDVAMWLSQRHYGEEPRYNYFMGGSQGGHEGFDAMQRFPDDYDGVVAGYPAHNVVLLHLSALNYARALAADDGAGWMNPQQIAFFTGEVYARCDALDAAEDGIISNVADCLEATSEFRLDSEANPLRCAQGNAAGDACLSSAQIRMLNALDTPFDAGFSIYAHDIGSSSFPKWTPFEGSTFMDGGNSNLGASGPDAALQRAPGVATNGLAIAQDLSLDVMADFDAREHAARIIEVASKLSANSVNLDRFRDKGGKLIFFHGSVDDYIPVYSSIEYYERLLARYGEDEAERFVRFYTIPGMGHVTGVFSARLASLDALEAWVERGEAPGELVAFDANTATAGRTRPVCLYPAWPRYSGAGDMNSADSFDCVLSSGD